MTRFRTVALLAALLAVLGTALIGVLSGTLPYTALGNGDPGALVRIGAPVLRAVATVSAALALGGLAFATLVSTPRAGGLLSPVGYDAVRSAGRWALLWFLASAVLVPFDVADRSGETLGRSFAQVFGGGDPFPLLAAMESPMGWLLSAVLAAATALSARFVLRWLPAVAVLLLGVLALLPPLVTGHAASEAGHDLASAAIVVHVPVAAIWGGVLVALLRPRWRTGLEPRRYRRLAGVAWCVLVVSGVFSTAPMFGSPGQLFGTGYGRLLLVKLLLVLLLGLAGLALRRNRIAPVLELLLLAAAGAASFGLSHLAPPAFIGSQGTVQETLLGYNLSAAPDLLRLLTDWRFDPLLGSLSILLALTYLIGLLRLRRNGEQWPTGRSLAWFAGCLVLLLATSSGIGRYAGGMFSVHITSHMLVSMLAPLLLAVGAPLSLARSQRLDVLANSGALRVLTHPFVALALFGGGPFLLYFTGLFDAAIRFHWAHVAINVVFLAIGYLFAWPVAGADPTPRPLPTLGRLGMLLAAMPLDIVFGALLTSTDRIIGNSLGGGNMYTALALPWVPDLRADQFLAGTLALLIGELSLLIAVVALLVRWKSIDRELQAMDVDLPAGIR
ncbi:cytochrome c oxidase assembly protein [Sciscionella marina]|uniref:cytochrome c oxidase assembly protein n=1 Tax=Sciscionella marina TaxID=508770 RepID=UPI00035F77A5|nr:cytochrome c oxidase assembly protein [Sciscionella marina]